MRLDHLRGTPGSRRRLEAQVWEGAELAGDPGIVPELHEVEVSPELKTRIENYMSRYPDFHSAAIPALRAAQEEQGWLSAEAIRKVAAMMRVTPAYLESIASFYDMFELDPVGRHTIYVCTNLSCTLRGADELVQAFSEETGAPVHGSSPDGEFHLRTFECLGACDIAPMASIDERYYGPLGENDARTAMEQLRSGAEVLPGKDIAERPAAGGPEAEPDRRVADADNRGAPGRGAEEAPR